MRAKCIPVGAIVERDGDLFHVTDVYDISVDTVRLILAKVKDYDVRLSDTVGVMQHEDVALPIAVAAYRVEKGDVVSIAGLPFFVKSVAQRDGKVTLYVIDGLRVLKHTFTRFESVTVYGSLL